MGPVELRIFLLQHGDEEARVRAARELRDYGSAAIDALCAEVRRLSAQLLPRIQDPSEELAALLYNLTSSDPATRCRAAAALAESGDPRALDCLLALFVDPHPEVRRSAVRAVSALNDARAVPGLRGLVEDPDNEVPILSVEALARLGATMELIEIAREARYDRARILAVRSLGQIDSRFADLALLQSLRDLDPEIRRAAALGLGTGHSIPPEERAEALVALFSDLPRVVEAAFEALGSIGAPAARALGRALESRHSATRSNALRALHQLARRRPEPWLILLALSLKGMRWRLRGEARRLCAETLDALDAAFPGLEMPIPAAGDPTARLPIPSDAAPQRPESLPRPAGG